MRMASKFDVDEAQRSVIRFRRGTGWPGSHVVTCCSTVAWPGPARWTQTLSYHKQAISKIRPLLLDKCLRLARGAGYETGMKIESSNQPACRTYRRACAMPATRPGRRHYDKVSTSEDIVMAVHSDKGRQDHRRDKAAQRCRRGRRDRAPADDLSGAEQLARKLGSPTLSGPSVTRPTP